MKQLLIIFFFSFTVFWACNSLFGGKPSEEIVAQVGGENLTMSQLKVILPLNMNKIDSISFAQNYIEKWVRNQLMLEKAEINLDKKTQESIEVMIDNYRTSLMLFKYQQLIIRQKLDTIVTDKQIDDYYSNNSGNFRLDSSVVKSIYIQLPKSLFNRNKVRRWIRSKKEEDIITLEDYCYQNARNFSMGEEWKYFGMVLSNLPRKISNQDAFLRYNKYIETTDSLYAYYVAILDYKLTNDTIPVFFVKNQIRNILINHRKVKLIKDLENNIYNDAVNQKKFIIHTN